MDAPDACRPFSVNDLLAQKKKLSRKVEESERKSVLKQQRIDVGTGFGAQNMQSKQQEARRDHKPFSPADLLEGRRQLREGTEETNKPPVPGGFSLEGLVQQKTKLKSVTVSNENSQGPPQNRTGAFNPAQILEQKQKLRSCKGDCDIERKSAPPASSGFNPSQILAQRRNLKSAGDRPSAKPKAESFSPSQALEKRQNLRRVESRPGYEERKQSTTSTESHNVMKMRSKLRSTAGSFRRPSMEFDRSEIKDIKEKGTSDQKTKPVPPPRKSSSKNAGVKSTSTPPSPPPRKEKSSTKNAKQQGTPPPRRKKPSGFEMSASSEEDCIVKPQHRESKQDKEAFERNEKGSESDEEEEKKEDVIASGRDRVPTFVNCAKRLLTELGIDPGATFDLGLSSSSSSFEGGWSQAEVAHWSQQQVMNAKTDRENCIMCGTALHSKLLSDPGFCSEACLKYSSATRKLGFVPNFRSGDEEAVSLEFENPTNEKKDSIKKKRDSKKNKQNDSQTLRDELLHPRLAPKGVKMQNVKNVAMSSATPQARLLIQGWLKKRAIRSSINVSWKKRFFQLKGKTLCYFEREGDSLPKCTGTLLSSSTISASDAKSHSFILRDVYGFKRPLIAQCENEIELRNWIEALQSAIDSHS